MPDDRSSASAASSTSAGKFEDALLQLSRLHATAGEPTTAVFTEGARIVTAALEIDRVSLWLLINEDQAIRCYHLYHPSLGEVYEGSILRASDFPTYFRSLAGRRILVLPDAQNDPESREMRESYLAPLGITSMLDVPVYREGRVSGVVCHEHIGPKRAWSTLECDFAVAVAEVIGRLCAESARMQAESALNHSQSHISQLQRFESLGRMAGGIAHDFRGTLSTVLGFSHLILDDPTASSTSRKHAREILAAGERGVRLTQELFAFGRESPEPPEVIDVAEVLASASDVLRLAAGPEIRIEVHAAPRVSRVLVDRALLERAVLNLITNARDAMPAGGTVTVTVAEERREASPQHEVPYVVLEVRDRGTGMDEETRQRMFEPFFTTKGHLGIGLGLLTVQHLTARSGGRVEVVSQRGEGTRIRLLLPRIAGPGPTDDRRDATTQETSHPGAQE